MRIEKAIEHLKDINVIAKTIYIPLMLILKRKSLSFDMSGVMIFTFH